MSTTQKTASKSTFSRKDVRNQIAIKLESALADFKPGMSAKKFKSRIKKASKLFSDHYAPSPIKKAVAPKAKSAVKAAPAKSALKKAATPRKKAAPAPHAS